MEKDSEESENKIVAKNIIYNNFQNKGFLNNFNFLHENIRNLNKSMEYNCDILNNKLDYSNCMEKNSFNKEKNKKKFIIHLMPSKNSKIYSFLNKKKEEVLKKYGKDDTYKYDIHISLTGYFFCDNVNVFLNTLYTYFFYYVKLYYTFKNLSFNHIFFNISYNSDYNSIYIKNKSVEIEKKRISEKEENLEKKEKKEKCIINKEEDNHKGGDVHVLITNDGYVIIPIFCEWIKRIFENFCFLIENNNFISHNQYKSVNKLENNYLYKNYFISKNYREKDKKYSKLNYMNSKLKSKYQKKKIDLDEIYINKVISSNIKNNKEIVESYINFEEKKKEEKINNSNELLYNNHHNNENNCNDNEDVSNKYEDNYNINKVNGSRGLINYKEQRVETNSCHNKKIKKLKKYNNNNIDINNNNNNNDNNNNDNDNDNNKDKKKEKNIIKYKYNNAEVNLSEFRIKECNHISLASNRNNKEIQKDIANMYKDLKYHFSNCSWDMVMFECEENLFSQEKVKNNFLNEIFRFKKFAIS